MLSYTDRVQPRGAQLSKGELSRISQLDVPTFTGENTLLANIHAYLDDNYEALLEEGMQYHLQSVRLALSRFLPRTVWPCLVANGAGTLKDRNNNSSLKC